MPSDLERSLGDEESLNKLIHAMSMASEIRKMVLDSPTDPETWVSRISADNSQRKFCCISAVHTQAYCGRSAEAQRAY